MLDDPPASPVDGFDDRYQLEELPLGRGGMGEVHEGYDRRLGRMVAVKFVRVPDGDPDPDLIRRFKRESRITARLRHPGVPAVYDSGVHEGQPYLVMERVEGISIADLIAESGRLPLGWAAAIGAQTCAVLAAAHAASLVHRDLKPDNLVLEPAGTVKVLDFGLATGEGVPELSRITQSGQALGTPAYMAPEQIQDGQSSARTDLYALGCTLFEMLTGQRPFAGATSYALMIKQVSDPPTPVRQIRPEIPTELANTVAQLLEKSPTDRPTDANIAYSSLLRFATELPPMPGVLAPPEQPSPLRMYAAAVNRIPGPVGTTPASPPVTQPPHHPSEQPPPPTPSPATPPAPSAPPAPTVATPSHPAPERSGTEHSEITDVRNRASALVRESRYSQAGALLGNAVAQARRSGTPLDPELVNLWWDWANVLFEGGDYHSAAPAFESLASVLSEHGSANMDLVFRCRRQHATCLALAGETQRALDLLRRLLADEQRILGAGDERPLELRRQIGMLLLRLGAPETRQVLRELLDDLVRLRGADHPSVRRVRALLERAPTG
ncbi:serine/threonine-protein kinase [Lipingzhangella sp. LS1_29]|uniref:non-specific serine/threonine protein kinase n=1 Tax=Lipingzhangella rawalii TaxID=2055835 RepID=A0ABU2H8F6_9ACTN|nr:serine/threonine-protein kinase [Lipingzhangella rawalii]MDS1271587.1 serine/threonine-protein kinase [Lipingzhangella rawalii]